ncbi:putative zinc finger protein [Micromonospora pisi]|uniref:Putative zinc finger protein n=1 Tax=Micromonospora pisi TaxID=589240 RepID=A0A495JCU3_9ACTN|nr:zf-HC2 domain-containing protein [Micromonospora pisi]RKR86328.1 putative zinc finger protein [Micromonospora pisi]
MTTLDSKNTFDDHVDIGGYLMETLDPEETRQVEQHLADCAECRAEVESLREWQQALETVPEAMLLDGPPEGGDLLLQRTLRQIRAESGGRRTRRNTLMSSAAVVVVAAAISAGVVVGRASDDGASQALPTPSPTVATAAPDTRFATADDATTGARITVALEPAPGWVRINAAVSGIPAGEPCKLLVIGKDGTEVLAGSWVVSQKGEAEGTTLDGSALIDPANVARVEVENVAGKKFTSVEF